MREGLRSLVDRQRRRKIGEAIVAGYRLRPMDDDSDLGWADEANAAMIGKEPIRRALLTTRLGHP